MQKAHQAARDLHPQPTLAQERLVLAVHHSVDWLDVLTACADPQLSAVAWLAEHLPPRCSLPLV